MAFEANNSKKTKQPSRLYKVSLKTQADNTVGTIYLNSQFLGAFLKKSEETITPEDILGLNYGNFETYIQSLSVVVESTIDHSEPINIEDF